MAMFMAVAAAIHYTQSNSRSAPSTLAYSFEELYRVKDHSRACRKKQRKGETVAAQLVDLGFRVSVGEDFDTRLQQVLATKVPAQTLDSKTIDFIRSHTVGAVQPYAVYAQGLSCTGCGQLAMTVSVQPAS